MKHSYFANTIIFIMFFSFLKVSGNTFIHYIAENHLKIMVDTDGDGVIDTTEVIDNTNPNDPCDYIISSITQTITSAADCDGDGVTEANEIIDGTDPNDACDYIISSITQTITSAADCDGDGVTNANEIIDGTDPNDPCSYNTASITQPIISAADCDGDGVTNANEIIDGTDPNDPCSFNTGSITVPVTNPLSCDIDGDGVLNTIDIDNDNDGILDTLETLNDNDGDGIPNAYDQDSDNDGIPDNVEAQFGTMIFASGIDSDGNGLDDSYETSPGSGNGLIPLDFNFSGIPDFLSQDSDNDSIIDNIEGFDLNRDGISDILFTGLDSDSDGLDDAFDGAIGYTMPSGLFVTNSFTDLIDTDADGQNDFRDTDDDGDTLLTINEPNDGDSNGFPDYLETTSIAQITGYVFEDIDLSTTITSGDFLLPFSLPLSISGSFGTRIINIDGSGFYSEIVPAGVVSISIDETLLPPSYTKTIGSNPTNVILTAGSSTNFNFGYVSTSFKLTAFLDSNNNGTRESNEVLFPNTSFTVTENSSTTQISQHASGTVTKPATIGTTYDFSISLDPAISSNYMIATSAFTGLTFTTGSQNNYDFAIQAINNTTQDAQVISIPLQDPRPGFDHNLNIVVKNNLHTSQSGVLDYQNDAGLTIIDILQGGTSVLSSTTLTASGFTIPYTLTSFESTTIEVILNVPTTSALGTIINNTSALIQSSVDAVISNNTYTLSQTVVGSYDPNDTFESRGPEIDINTYNTGDVFIYTIRFQNLGTASAIFIRVENTLDIRHDPSTLVMVKSSHNYELTQTGSQLSWFFDQIFLPPDITGGDLSNGYIVFRVDPLPPFAVNDIINQRAEIYFDYNSPVITDVFESKFVDNTASIESVENQISVYPNPLRGDILNLKELEEAQYSLYSISGQIVQNGIIKNGKADLSSVKAGIYLIKINNSQTITTLKIIKE